MISMPYGGGAQFDEQELVAYIRASGRDYIITGWINRVYEEHTKPHSLDFWLRSKTKYHGVRQTCKALINDLVATGLFVEQRGLKCPDSGYSCQGIRLTSAG